MSIHRCLKRSIFAGMLRIGLISIIILVLTSCLIANGLLIRGSIVYGDISPGQDFKYIITAEGNADDAPTDYNVSTWGFGQSVDGVSQKIGAENDTSPYSARSFLNVMPKRFHLNPNESQNITLEGTIPQNVKEGGRYAIISVMGQPPGSGMIGIAMGVDIPVLLIASGSRPLLNGIIDEIRIDTPIKKDEQNITLIFNNTGNYHYKAFASAILKDQRGNLLANASTPLSFSSILPGSHRVFELSLKPSSQLGSGTYIVASNVTREDGTLLATKNLEITI